ncbi:MAG: sigma 54-interacting transcriptional regulator [Firmicutes bacterium]|nr:sigma 54-interacting transcriptional regulator [Bacillota bacterium]
MATEIVFLAPDEESAETARRVSRAMGVELGVEACSGHRKIEAATRAVRNGAEVLISRWGFSHKEMSERLGVPLIPTKITAIDLTRAMVKANSGKGRICVVSSAPVVQCAIEMAFYLNIPVAMTRVLRSLDPAEISEALDAVRRVEGTAVVGGVTITTAATRIGLQGIQIQIGEEVLADAISEAQRIIPAKRRERAKAEEIRTIIDSISDGVIAVDQQGDVTVFNKAAERLTGIPAHAAVGEQASLIVPELDMTKPLQSNEVDMGALQCIRGKQVVINQAPVITNGRTTGAILTFTELSKIQTVEQKARKELSARGLLARFTLDDVLGTSAGIREATALARKLSVADEPVLILGETGTGKEVFAQGIHNASRRREGPFVAINCAAIPESLLESELFGYVEGAFTGARKLGKPGLFELAHGGTIFLDEIGETPVALQPRLLRVLQEKEVIRLGDDRVIPVDVRIVAATNVELDELVADGRFRPDLYHRLNVLALRLPPLRERPEDIVAVFEHFAYELRRKGRQSLGKLTDEAALELRQHGWPGNVRELRNVVHRLATLFGNELEITGHHVRQVLYVGSNHRARIRRISEVEGDLILEALKTTNGNKAKAAAMLGISYCTLWRRLKALSQERSLAK